MNLNQSPFTCYLTLSLVLIGLSACKDEPINEAELNEKKVRIENLLSKKIVSNGTTITTTLKGCVLIKVLERSENFCTSGPSHYWKIETRIDLRDLITKPKYVNLNERRNGRDTDQITYEYHKKINNRYYPLTKRAFQISNEEFKKHPTDVPKRLEIISSRYKTELDINLFRNNLQTSFFCSGVQIAKPHSSMSTSIYTLPNNGKELITLIHQYRLSCER
jgi:hypothetical protein